MRSHMNHQGSPLTEPFPAMRTDMRFFLRMHPDVIPQGATPCKLLATEVTRKLLYARMQFIVDAQFGFVLKHLAAHVAHVVTGHTAVSDVTLHAQGVGEDLTALDTSEFFCRGTVCPHVAHVVLFAHDDFIAYLARVSDLVVNGVYVLLEVVRAFELLVALRAWEVYGFFGVRFHVFLQVDHVLVTHVAVLALALMIKQVAFICPGGSLQLAADATWKRLLDVVQHVSIQALHVRPSLVIAHQALIRFCVLNEQFKSSDNIYSASLGKSIWCVR